LRREALIMKALLTTTAFLFILFASAHAQSSDYIINNNNDTIKCHVKESLGGLVRYRLNNGGNGKYIKINIDSIKEYYLSKHKAAYRRIYANNYVYGASFDYLRVIERGVISLYQETTYYSDNSTDRWYISKNSDTAQLLKTSGLSIFIRSRGIRKNELAEMLKDKPSVYNKFIKDKKFGWNAVKNIVYLYNTGHDIRKK
jgi:hypothetical protein